MTAGPLLDIDTATRQIVVAVGGTDGAITTESAWEAGYRHGETLLPAVEDVLARSGAARRDLRAVIGGTGPGAFTGLRVGLATAKGLARGLGIPIVGVPTGEALLAAAAAADGMPIGALALLMPAGPSDRVLVTGGTSPVIVRAGDEPDVPPGTTIVAVDLEDRAPADALERGGRARAGLARALLRAGAARLAADSGGDDLARLVPEYVTLPRGVAAPIGEVTWSRDHR